MVRKTRIETLKERIEKLGGSLWKDEIALNARGWKRSEYIINHRLYGMHSSSRLDDIEQYLKEIEDYLKTKSKRVNYLYH